MGEFNEIRQKIEKVLNLNLKRVYVVTFNFYSFYWIYKLIFIQEVVTWEDWFLWFFTTTGMNFFVKDNQDIYFKKKKKSN